MSGIFVKFFNLDLGIVYGSITYWLLAFAAYSSSAFSHGLGVIPKTLFNFSVLNRLLDGLSAATL